MTSGTLFIPDISGFTHFVNATEIKHSQHIIEELVNLIIKEGKALFEVAEIEGDAVLFYRQDLIAESEITQLTHRIFVDFHSHLLRYANERICQCGACTTAIDLKLKFIVHAGEMSLAKYSAGNPKPYGTVVNVAHRLLKNDIMTRQYLLMTNDFLGGANKYDTLGQLTDPDLGQIAYQYLDISHWQQEARFEPKSVIYREVDLELTETFDMRAKSDLLFPFITDLKYRKYWNEDADDVIYDQAQVNQPGMSHHCVVNNKDLYFNTIKPPASNADTLSYGETLKNPKPLKYMELDFFVTPLGIDRSAVQLIVRASVRNWMQRLMLPLIQRKLRQHLRRSRKSLESAFAQHYPEVVADYITPVADRH